jgi:hypothetical protein
MSKPTLTAPPVGALTDGEVALLRAWAEDYAGAVLAATVREPLSDARIDELWREACAPERSTAEMVRAFARAVERQS